MFQQFTQFNRNALQGGRGSNLGLWICENLAAFMEADWYFSDSTSYGLDVYINSLFFPLILRSFTPHGSTFFVDLPIYMSKDSSFSSSIQQVPAPFGEQIVTADPWSLPYPAHISLPSGGGKEDENEEEDEEDDSRNGEIAKRRFRRSFIYPSATLLQLLISVRRF